MKKCNYCGLENPDEATQCAICHTSLVTPTPSEAPQGVICGLLSIATPLIGGLLLYMLWGLVGARIGEAFRQHQIAHPGQGFSMDTGNLYLAMSLRVLIPTPIIGIGFGVLALKRQESRALPIVGFFLNLVAILFLIVHIVLVRFLSYMFV
jgi:hypothetical protein